MNVLVTGGSGFLGTHLIRSLQREGVGEPVSLDLQIPFPQESGRFQTIQGDIRNKDTVKEACRNVDAVVHAAAALPLYDEIDIRTTEIDGTELLLDESVRQGIRRFIFISSSAVYGIPDHHPIVEGDLLNGVGPYGRAKIEAEKLCHSYREKGLAVTILRPKTFIGPERLGVFSILYRWAAEGRAFPVIGTGDNLYQLLDVQDLVTMIVLCLKGDPDSVTHTFNVGAAEFGTLKDDFQSVLDLAGFGKCIVPLPAKPVQWLLRVLSVLGISPLYSWVYDTAGRESWLSIQKATDVLGFVPEYSNQDALRRNYEWYLANVYGGESATGIGHRNVWKEGVLNFIRLFF